MHSSRSRLRQKLQVQQKNHGQKQQLIQPVRIQQQGQNRQLHTHHKRPLQPVSPNSLQLELLQQIPLLQQNLQQPYLQPRLPPPSQYARSRATATSAPALTS